MNCVTFLTSQGYRNGKNRQKIGNRLQATWGAGYRGVEAKTQKKVTGNSVTLFRLQVAGDRVL